MTTATPQRIYVIGPKKAEGGMVPKRRLVRAPNQAQAIRFVASDTLQATVASQDDLVDLVTSGIEVESSNAAPAEQLQLDV